MNFFKGMIVGGAISAGIVMMYAENSNSNKKKIMKKGKQYMRKMGII